MNATIKQRFKVVPFTNPRTGSISWRVTGRKRDGTRIRENFKDEHSAKCRRVELEAEYLKQRESMSGMQTQSKEITARAATIDELLSNVVPNFLQPPPSRDTFRAWLNAANVPRMKANPHAKRGGGPCYYSVPAVEKLLRSRMLPGRMASPVNA